VKLHPLSLPFRALPRGVQLGSFGFFIVTVTTTTVAAVPDWFALTVAATIGGFLAGVGYEVLYYRRFEYELTTDTLDIGSGVLSRREREIPIRRVQNVDISRGIVQRALSIAAVGIETAGGGETEADLRYVSYEEAKRLQHDIRRRKRGASDEPIDADEDDEAQAELLFELTPRNLVVLGLVAPDLRALLPVLLFAVPTLGISIPRLLTESGVFGVGPRGAALAIVSWIGTAAVTAARYYDFRLARFDDELRYERGLLSRYEGSIPIDKIQQIDVRENVLMRWLGYGSLAVETAGYTPGEGPSGGSEAAIPLAERERVLAFARSIDGFDFDDPEFSRPPRRARRRYGVRYALVIAVITAVLYAMHAGLATVVLGRPLGGGWNTLFDYWYVPLAGLVAVPLAAHYKWRSRGYDVGSIHVLTRNGFWRRTIAVVPAYRVQTVIQTATPFQRWRSLANVAIDTAGSLSVTDRGARAVDFDASEVTVLRETVRQRLDESLAVRRSLSTTNDTSGDTPPDEDVDEDHV
jgi:putative membrane protein